MISHLSSAPIGIHFVDRVALSITASIDVPEKKVEELKPDLIDFADQN